jgi:hypothetical protein
MDAGYELLTALDEDSVNMFLHLFTIICIVAQSSDKLLKMIEIGFFQILSKYLLFSTCCRGSSGPNLQTEISLLSMVLLTVSLSDSILRSSISA